MVEDEKPKSFRQKIADKWGKKSLGQKIIESWGTVEDIRNKDLSNITQCFEKYKSGKRSKHDFDIFMEIYCEKSVPLPSGRYGNILALALEMRELDIASEILEVTKIETDSISSEFGGKNRVSLMDYINEQRESYGENDVIKLDEMIAKAIIAKENKRKETENREGIDRED